MIKSSICGKEEFEEEDAKHISVKHGFENPLQYPSVFLYTDN
jgi:hypothetical protein